MNLCTNAPLVCLFLSFLPLASVPLSVAQVLHPEQHKKVPLVHFTCLSLCRRCGSKETSGYRNTSLTSVAFIVILPHAAAAV